MTICCFRDKWSNRRWSASYQNSRQVSWNRVQCCQRAWQLRRRKEGDTPPLKGSMLFVLSGTWRLELLSAPSRRASSSLIPPSFPSLHTSPHHGQQETHTEPGSWGFSSGDARGRHQSRSRARGLLQAVPQRAAACSHQGTAELQLCLLFSGKRGQTHIYSRWSSCQSVVFDQDNSSGHISCFGNQTFVVETE